MQTDFLLISKFLFERNQSYRSIATRLPNIIHPSVAWPILSRIFVDLIEVSSRLIHKLTYHLFMIIKGFHVKHLFAVKIFGEYFSEIITKTLLDHGPLMSNIMLDLADLCDNKYLKNEGCDDHRVIIIQYFSRASHGTIGPQFWG